MSWYDNQIGGYSYLITSRVGTNRRDVPVRLCEVDDDDDDDDGQRLHKTILMKGFMKVRFKRFCNPPLVAGVRAVVTVITMPRSERESKDHM